MRFLIEKIFFALFVLAALIWGIWIAFPVSAIEATIKDFAGDREFAVSVDGLKKGLFFSLRADSIALKYSESEIIAFSSVRADINPLNVIAFGPAFSFRGGLGKGSFSGDAVLSRNKPAVNIDFERAQMHDMRFLTTAGIRGTGTISGRISMTGLKWEMEFLVRDAGFEPAFVAGVFLPLNFFETVKGSVRLEGRAVDIVSVSLKGPDIFARLKGVVRDGVADMRMEVMPEKTFLGNPLFVSQIERYRESPGYYVIPVNGPVVP